jgi:glucokinase
VLLISLTGTYVRTGLSTGSNILEVTNVEKVERARFANVEEVITESLLHYGLTIEGAGVAIGLAGPVDGDFVGLTNVSDEEKENWTFSISGLRTKLRLRNLVVLNDFQAVGLGCVVETELNQVAGSTEPDEMAQKVVIGPGSGLGVGGLKMVNGVWVPVASQGGHIPLVAPAGHGVAEAVVRLLGQGMDEKQRFHPERARRADRPRRYVSAEKGALSGPGIINLYLATCVHLDREPVLIADAEEPNRALTSENITCYGLAGTDFACQETVDLFRVFLGSTAGTQTLAFAANKGGCYIAGGIVPSLGEDFLHHSSFTSAFGFGSDRADMTDYVSDVPVVVVPDIANRELIGLAYAMSTAA